jgi:Ankyrin repeats (3 copies)
MKTHPVLQCRETFLLNQTPPNSDDTSESPEERTFLDDPDVSNRISEFIDNSSSFPTLQHISSPIKDHATIALEQDKKKLWDAYARDAADTEIIPLIEKICEQKCNIDIVDIKNADNVTLLHLASEKGWIKIAKKLIAMGFNRLNIAAKNGNTPLHIACENGQPKIIELLIKKGAYTDMFNCQGQTPFHKICAHTESIVAIEMLDCFLFHFDPDLKARSADGFQALDFALESGVYEAVMKKETDKSAPLILSKRFDELKAEWSQASQAIISQN